LKIIIANIAFLMLLIAVSMVCLAQSKDSITGAEYFGRLYKKEKRTEVLTGFNVQYYRLNGVQGVRKYFELGVARSAHFDGRHGPASMGYYISEEVYFGGRNIYGSKIGIYTHYMVDIGFSIIYYTDFSKGNLKLRPEFGLGMGSLRIVGGYNIPTFANKSFEELRKSNGQLIIQWLIPVKRKIINKDGNIFEVLFKN
jgi:hypothetical protein